MARGQESKSIIANKILEIFEGSFLYDKEIRIPMIENGEEVQIKCTLTCAKVNVAGNGSLSEPKSEKKNVENSEITEQEKEEVRDIISKLNL